VGASLRDLGQYASCSIQAVSNALGRLVRAGLIRRAGYENGTGRYDLSVGWTNMDIRHRGATYSEPEKGVEVVGKGPKVGVKSAGAGRVPGGMPVDLPGGNELWSETKHGLGRSAGAVFFWLSDDLIGVAELAERTGKCERTVKRALAKLGDKSLASGSAGGWVRGVMPVREVAELMEARKYAMLRHEHHERERLAWDDTKARAGKGTSVG
jgi:predicted transcriptional regulator